MINTECILSCNNVMCDVLFILIKQVNFREFCILSNQELGKLLLTLCIFSLKFKFLISLELV